MRNISRFLRFGHGEQKLLVGALAAVAGIRIGLSLMSFPRFYGLLERFRASIRRSYPFVNRPSTGEVAWAVRAVSAYVPRATCLVQALGAQVLLERYGYPTVVHIGVTGTDKRQGGLLAHAWLESNGSVVIGASEVPYVPLATLSEWRGGHNARP